MSSSPSLSEAARAAAAWWGHQAKDVRAETDGLHPELSSSQAYAATAGIALRVQELKSSPVSDQVVEAFEAELAHLVDAAEGRMLRLHVDYQPCPELAQAAEAAGLPAARFPGKAAMRIQHDHVLAKARYGAPWRLVWSAPGWHHPACGVQDWPDDSDDPVGPECGKPRWHEGGHDWQ